MKVKLVSKGCDQRLSPHFQNDQNRQSNGLKAELLLPVDTLTGNFSFLIQNCGKIY
jgi:hypothetical protein